jgi:hypothetical protein
MLTPGPCVKLCDPKIDGICAVLHRRSELGPASGRCQHFRLHQTMQHLACSHTHTHTHTLMHNHTQTRMHARTHARTHKGRKPTTPQELADHATPLLLTHTHACITTQSHAHACACTCTCTHTQTQKVTNRQHLRMQQTMQHLSCSHTRTHTSTHSRCQPEGQGGLLISLEGGPHINVWPIH